MKLVGRWGENLSKSFLSEIAYEIELDSKEMAALDEKEKIRLSVGIEPYYINLF